MEEEKKTEQDKILFGLGGSKGSLKQYVLTPFQVKILLKKQRQQELVEKGIESRERNKEYKPVRRRFVSPKDKKKAFKLIREEIRKLEEADAKAANDRGTGSSDVDSGNIASLLTNGAAIQRAEGADKESDRQVNGSGEDNSGTIKE